MRQSMGEALSSGAMSFGRGCGEWHEVRPNSAFERTRGLVVSSLGYLER